MRDRIRTWKQPYDEEEVIGEVNKMESLTVPDQALSISELVANFRRGVPIPRPRPKTDDELEIEKMDKIDQLQFVEQRFIQAKQQYDELQEQRTTGQTDMEEGTGADGQSDGQESTETN